MKLDKLALEQLNSKKSLESIKLLLEHESCPHRLKVEFAYYCAKDSLRLVDKTKRPEVYAKSLACLELVERWLEDSSKVTKADLEEAANSAYSAYSAAYYAAAYSAYSAAATTAAYSAAAENKETKLKNYLIYLVKLILKEFNCNYKTIDILYGTLNETI
jgi:hypothetical protein